MLKYKILVTLFFLWNLSAVLSLEAQNSPQFEKLQGIIREVQEDLAPDKRTSVFEISIRLSDTKFILIGKTSLASAKNEILRRSNISGIEWKDSIRLLPDPQSGLKPYALVRLSVANLRSNPAHSSELATQALLGTPLLVLEQKEEWYRVQTPDNYISWIDQGGLAFMDAADLERWKQGNRLIFLENYGSVYQEAALAAPLVSDLVAGDILEYTGLTNGFYQVRFPDGRKGYLPAPQAMDFDKWLEQGDPLPSDLITAALRFTGLPYLWGGTSSKGVDCSGFTKSSWFLNRVIIQRDASQQVLYGKNIPLIEAPSGLQAGDLLFFGTRGKPGSRDRISHVGMYRVAGEYLHSSGYVRSGSLSFPLALPAPGTFGLLQIRRYIDDLDSPGICRVRTHPMYFNQQKRK